MNKTIYIARPTAAFADLLNNLPLFKVGAENGINHADPHAFATSEDAVKTMTAVVELAEQHMVKEWSSPDRPVCNFFWADKTDTTTVMIFRSGTGDPAAPWDIFREVCTIEEVAAFPGQEVKS